MSTVLSQLESTQRWQKLGRILEPRAEVPWLSTWTGAAFARRKGQSDRFDVYVAGRDSENRSRIGRVSLSLTFPPSVVDISPDPILDLGELGAFDENGTSYPCVVQNEDRLHLYYTGWMPTRLTPFQVHLGLAISAQDGSFQRFSRAPLLDRTDEDPFSIGSVYVLRERDIWRMWYTSFLGWGRSRSEPKHTYVIKYADSRDGIRWQRSNEIAINLQHPGEHSIARPSVIKRGEFYYMWYCYRGESYRIGYAVSKDGIQWSRRDDRVGLTTSSDGWDSECICYPHVFEHESRIYMLYCGNDYGRAGLGLARLDGD